MRKLLLVLLFFPLISFAQLGEYWSGKNHPKAKGLNFKIQIPIGFSQDEAVRPNIVQIWENEDINIMILVYEQNFELTTSEMTDYLKNGGVKEFVSNFPKDLNTKNEKFIVLDNYPGLFYQQLQTQTRLDITMSFYSYTYSAMVENYTFMFQLYSETLGGLIENRKLFDKMANSIVFPDQYNYEL